ncbi:MAG: hypothetical protein SNJ75_18665 [Gemmataceae bacterium]
MLRIFCDGCGRELATSEDRHILKLEVYTANEPAELTEDDLDADHLEMISTLLQQEMPADQAPSEPSYTRLRYDLCNQCRKRFLRDPLAREAATKFHFSKN